MVSVNALVRWVRVPLDLSGLGWTGAVLDVCRSRGGGEGGCTYTASEGTGTRGDVTWEGGVQGWWDEVGGDQDLLNLCCKMEAWERVLFTLLLYSFTPSLQARTLITRLT